MFKTFSVKPVTNHTFHYNGTATKISADLVGWFMVFNATFNNITAISWQSILLVEVNGENHRPVASH
jgi:thiamine phosphate synthase YjbQ (UPF0047 family)